MRWWRVLLLAALAAFAPAGPSAAAQPAMINADAWSAYKAKFLDASGRIIDNGNGNISHSEGQGYGMLLAYLSASPADFEQIWYFTRTELLLRDDGLAVWKWDPNVKPHVTDTNNATDGDMLIAYALALAGTAWKRNDYILAASRMAQALLAKAVVRSAGRTLLMPGSEGFGAADRGDGPVVNPSYWIYEAMPVMAALAPSDAWKKLSDDGVALLKTMQFGPRKLPAEWVSLSGPPRPAEGFDAEFAYNALRIPLYLARGGIRDKALLNRLRTGMSQNGIPVTIDLTTGRPKTVLLDPGYRIVNDVVACVIDGTRLPVSALQFAPTLYYPSTLQLLGLAYIGEKHPECL
ncbi:endoglucanase [Rhizobium sp. S9]|uniref:glycosyl hydrolase family 8 n=1 Tax=unclassified Rhizobium TaxID=2613769 RepID=UPI000A20FE09|nr:MULTISPECIES: glycosyl hydrolase family 8 [unclassified Rhizobium]ARO23483.1 endoglucanase protein [Rhizobium sp. TAL182]PDS97223.1 endoglucanase [Rhizobium sp. S9]